MAYESKFTKRYFDQIFGLFPEFLRPKGRRTFKAYDGLNNLFTLGYERGSWNVLRVLIRKLESYLGNARRRIVVVRHVPGGQPRPDRSASEADARPDRRV
jgi:hypothetical protein